MGTQMSGGAIAILRHMRKNKLKIHGDPSKDVPWFYIPFELTRTVPKTDVAGVDAPASQYCLELVEHGFLCLESGSPEAKQGFYSISRAGAGLLGKNEDEK